MNEYNDAYRSERSFRGQIDRRRFLQTSTASLAFSSIPVGVFGMSGEAPKRVGLIGAGWYGKSDLWRLMQVASVEVVSICDPDMRLLKEAASMAGLRQNSGEPRTYGDFRKMLSENDLDVVIVGSPDHWHALHTIASIEAGADVYVQKPISVDVREGEAMLDSARRHGRVVQVGMQRRSTPHFVEVKEQVIERGLLGKIGHIEMCCYYPMRALDEPPLQPVPDFFDYQMWTGPAPLRPYDGLPHRRWWRAFMEYSNGIVGDMCVHMLDAVRWMLGLGWPRQITSTGGILVQQRGKSNTSDTQTATFEFDDFSAVWQHRSWGTATDPDYPWALFIYGEKGTLKASTMKAEFVPYDRSVSPLYFECRYERDTYPEDLSERDIELHAAPATRRHMIDFLKAIKKRSRPIADIQEGYISTASCILANLSMQLGGRPLSYDPQRRIVHGDEEATQLLKRPYRNPWQHPGDA
jgi:predicted dehydrogenase